MQVIRDQQGRLQRVSELVDESGEGRIEARHDDTPDPPSMMPALRIWSAAFRMRWAERSGIALPLPHQLWMYPRENSTPGSSSAAQHSMATASASHSRRLRGVCSESAWPLSA